MESTAGRETRQESQAQRRRLLQAALAVTAGGGLQSPATADAIAQPGTASPPHPGGMHGSMLQDAIKACLNCHSTCLRTSMSYCLERGGRHVEQEHFRLMLNCAEMCQTSANFMLSDSPLQGKVCAVCAETCEACAKSCEQVGDMRECVEECRRCAKSCRSMA